MKHHGAQYGVECCVRKWQLLDSRIFQRLCRHPAFLAFLRALLIISGESSIPHTLPFGPTRCLAVIARVPVPQPTSKTDSPGFRPAKSTTFLRKAPSLPSHITRSRRSYPKAQWPAREIARARAYRKQLKEKKMARLNSSPHRTRAEEDVGIFTTIENT